MIEYYQKMPNPPKITLVWFVREGLDKFQRALDLKGHERAKNFHCLIIRKNGALPQVSKKTATLFAEHAERQAFLRLYQPEGINHRQTIDALLSWVLSSSSPSLLSKKMQDTNQVSKIPEGLLVAMCGHFMFENGLTEALKDASVNEDQIFRFPEGSMPLSNLAEFIPEHNGNKAIRVLGSCRDFAEVPDMVSGSS